MRQIVFEIFAVGFTVTNLLAQAPTTDTNAQMTAILNLRKLAMAESTYAMWHPKEGFACDPHVLTKVEWPNSPQHVPLVDPALLSGKGRYRFSVRCADGSNPAGKLNVLAEPLDQSSGLPTFCATGTFRSKPFRGTSEFPIRRVRSGIAESCLLSGKPLT